MFQQTTVLIKKHGEEMDKSSLKKNRDIEPNIFCIKKSLSLIKLNLRGGVEKTLTFGNVPLLQRPFLKKQLFGS